MTREAPATRSDSSRRVPVNAVPDDPPESPREDAPGLSVLRLVQAVSAALAEHRSVTAATEAVLAAVAGTFGWRAGVAWTPAAGESGLRPTIFTAASDADLRAVRAALGQHALERGGAGAVADAWRSARARRVVGRDPAAPNHDVLTALDCRAATAVAVTGSEGVHAVLEFYHEDAEPLDASSAAALDSAGALAGLFTERRRAEARERDEKRLRSAIMEGALDGIVGVDAYGHVREFNPAAERIFGLSRDEAAGAEIGSLLEVGSARTAYETALAAVTEAERRGEPGARLELTGRRADHSRFPAEVTVAEVAGAGDVRYSFTLRDITDRKEQEKATRRLLHELDRERDRLQDLVASVPGVVWEAWGEPDAANQRIDFVSEFAEPFLGYTRDEWLAEPNFWLKIVHPDDQAGAAERARGTFFSREPGLNRFRWLAKDGRVIDVMCIARTIRDAEGQPVGMRGINLDVTAQTQAERRLALQLAVTSRLASADSLDEVGEALVADAVRALGWGVGTLWAAVPHMERMECRAFWQEPGVDASAFEAATRSLPAVKDATLPGRVLASGEPVWVRDVTRDADFTRASDAAAAGLRGAFAFPVMADGRVVAVFEFFTRDALDADEQLLETTRAMAFQVAAFLEKTRARDRSREELARRAAMVEAALDCIISIDADGRVTEWNPAAEATFGWKRDEVLGREMAALIVPEAYREAHRNGLRRTVVTGDGHVLGTRVHMPALRRDGSEFPAELAIVPAKTGGRPAFTGFLRDLSRDGARAREARLRFLGDVIPAQVWSADPDGQLDYVNARVEEYFGRSADALVASGWETVVHPEDLDDVLARWSESLASAHPYEVRFRLRRADGAYVWHRGRALPQRNSAGRVVKWFGVNVPDTDRVAPDADPHDESG